MKLWGDVRGDVPLPAMSAIYGFTAEEAQDFSVCECKRFRARTREMAGQCALKMGGERRLHPYRCRFIIEGEEHWHLTSHRSKRHTPVYLRIGAHGWVVLREVA